MKIAFIVDSFPTLSETFILNQITGLLDEGHDVEIFAQYNPNQKKVHEDVNKYHLMRRIYYFNTPRNRIERLLRAMYIGATNLHKDPCSILKTLNIFKYGKDALSLKLLYSIIPFLGKRFDIIHCQFGLNGNIGAFLKQTGFKSKLVTTFHGYDVRLGIKKGGGIYRQLFKSGDCFLAVSDYSYRNLLRFGVNSQKIIFHPVGIDVDNFPYRWQSTVVNPANPVIILTIARLVEEKGLQYGIQAIAELLEQNPELHLEYWIIGGGWLEERLRKLSEELNLNSVVHFKGAMRQKEVIREIEKAHIFLLSSIAEVLPVVLIEAQAVGLPVIATNVGSVSQAISNGKSGFLVPERDVSALVEKLKYFIEHPEIWPEVGKRGREFVKKHYNIKELNQRLVQIYQNLVKSNNKYC